MAVTPKETKNYIHDTCYPRVLCSARCKHNDGDGYYNLCKHPCTANPRPYGGITRYYVDRCELLEKPDDKALIDNVGGDSILEIQLEVNTT